jgi:hypothetical protein
MVLADIGLGQLIWTTFFLFMLAALVWVFIVVVRDLFGNRELSGWAKAGWLVALILVPLLGSIVYIIVRGLWTGTAVGRPRMLRRGRSSPGPSSSATTAASPIRRGLGLVDGRNAASRATEQRHTITGGEVATTTARARGRHRHNVVVTGSQGQFPWTS